MATKSSRWKVEQHNINCYIISHCKPYLFRETSVNITTSVPIIVVFPFIQKIAVIPNSVLASRSHSQGRREFIKNQLWRIGMVSRQGKNLVLVILWKNHFVCCSCDDCRNSGWLLACPMTSVRSVPVVARDKAWNVHKLQGYNSSIWSNIEFPVRVVFCPKTDLVPVQLNPGRTYKLSKILAAFLGFNQLG